MATKIIDVSTWQGNIDWSKVKADGVQGAIIRAGFGNVASQKDNKFERNYTNAKAVGMPIGAYWYSYATSVADAKKEAEVCLSILKGKQFEYPIYYDLEDPSMTGCGKSVLTQIATTFCETLESAGYYVGIYSNPNWLKNYLDYNTIKKYTLWLAHWGVSEPSYKCGLWQYSSSGSVSGISGRVDMNWGYQDFPTEIKNGKFNGFGEASKPVQPVEPSKPTTSNGFKVGDTVRVKNGAKTYDGGSLASFVYNRDHKISELSGDRAVITYDGVVVAAVNTKDLTKGGSSASSSTKPIKPSKPATSSIKVGDTVKVKRGANTYNGGSLASFVYDRNHKVSEVSGNRAVITYDGTVVAAVNTKDLIKVGGSTPSSSYSASIKKGDKVRVKSGAKTYDGGGLASFVYSTTYDVLEVSGNRVVIGIGSAVTAAVKMSDLTKA